jgi:cytoskeletal protein RodZ
LFLSGNAQGDEIMLLIAGIVLVVSGILGFILQFRYIQERQTENAKS